MNKSLIVLVGILSLFFASSGFAFIVTADTASVELLMDSINEPGTLNTKNAAFLPDSLLNTKSLAEDLPLSSDQICMSLGEFQESEDFELIKSEAAQTIKFKGDISKGVKITATCGKNKEELIQLVQSHGLEEGSTVQNCNALCSEIRCCLITLKRDVEGETVVLISRGVLNSLLIIGIVLVIAGVAILILNKKRKITGVFVILAGILFLILYWISQLSVMYISV